MIRRLKLEMNIKWYVPKQSDIPEQEATAIDEAYKALCRMLKDWSSYPPWLSHLTKSLNPYTLNP